MIPARRITVFSNLFMRYVALRMRSYFNRVVIPPFEVKEGHSVLLLCNHFSWWDGLWAGHLARLYFKREAFIMMQEDHLQKRMFLNFCGGFSINRSSREMIRSLQYAAGLLNNKENLVIVFPQGALISNHTPEILVERGIELLLKNIKGPCQIVYSCALIDYFESLKPSVFFHFYDCGVAGQVTFEDLNNKINTFHQQALKAQLDVAH